MIPQKKDFNYLGAHSTHLFNSKRKGERRRGTEEERERGGKSRRRRWGQRREGDKDGEGKVGK